MKQGKRSEDAARPTVSTSGSKLGSKLGSTPVSKSARRTSRGARGVTVMEVMLSIGVLTLGVTGVVAVQKATIVGNRNARTIATANAIAATWAERLQADALQWNATRNAPDDLTTETTWLKKADTGWFNPVENVALGAGPAGSPRADVLGTDIFLGDPAVDKTAYCTKVRVVKLAPAFPQLIRAEIRVYWSRNLQPITCSPLPDPELGSNATFGFISVVTLVKQNPAL